MRPDDILYGLRLRYARILNSRPTEGSSDTMAIPSLSAWEDGVSLWGAVEKYTNEALWNQYVTLKDELHLTVRPEIFKQDFARGPDPPLDEDPVKRYQLLYEKFVRIETQLTSEILTSLTIGVLLAVGYTSPRLRGRVPVWIEPECWGTGKVDWAQSELWADGNRFEEVRIIQSHASAAAEAVASISPTKPPRHPGRPSRADEIRSAYKTLRDSGKINFMLSLRANLPTIREGVHALSGNPSDQQGLGDEAMRRVLGEQFKRDQVERKGSR
jgi:hypothetical protein